jgi:hypothetical protein
MSTPFVSKIGASRKEKKRSGRTAPHERLEWNLDA